MIHSKKVIAVSRILVTALPEVKRTGNNTVNIAPGAEWENLHIEVPATLTISSKIEKHCLLHNAKLVFRNCSPYYEDSVFVYMVTLANGDKMLIGDNDRPYATAETKFISSSSSSNSELLEVSISYSSSKEIATVR